MCACVPSRSISHRGSFCHRQHQFISFRQLLNGFYLKRKQIAISCLWSISDLGVGCMDGVLSLLEGLSRSLLLTLWCHCYQIPLVFISVWTTWIAFLWDSISQFWLKATHVWFQFTFKGIQSLVNYFTSLRSYFAHVVNYNHSSQR